MKNKQLFVGIGMLMAIILVAFTFAPALAVLAVAPLAGLVSSNKLKEQRTALQTELAGYDKDLQDLMGKVKTENRNYTDEENAKRSELVGKSTKLLSDITALGTQIELRIHEEGIEARVAGKLVNEANAAQEDKELRNYSLLRAIDQASKGQLSGLEAEMDQEGRKELTASAVTASGNLVIPNRIISSRSTRKNMAEARAALLAVTGGGANLVQTDVTDFIGALYAKNVLTGLGAQMITGLVGNISIPKSGGSTASWEGETDENADGTPTITPVTASPKRLGAYGLLGKQLLIQAGNYDVEKFAQDEIINAITAALQIAAINGSGTGQPLGILNTSNIGAVLGGTNGADPASSHVVSLEEAIATANADINALGFLTNPKVRGKLKKTTIDAGSGQMVWDLKTANELMGYKAGVTSAVPSNLTKGEGTDLSALIFGNFADLMLLQWGGFDIVVNPYTYSKTNQLEITVNSFWDVIVRNAASFAAMKDVKTT